MLLLSPKTNILLLFVHSLPHYFFRFLQESALYAYNK